MATLRSPNMRRVGTLLQQAAEPIFLLDDACRIAFVNSAWELLTGYASEVAIGLACHGPRPILDAGLEALGVGLAPSLDDSQPRPHAIDSVIVDAGGQRTRVSIWFQPLTSSGGTLIGLLGVIRPGEQSEAPSTALQLRRDLLSLRERLRAARHGAQLVGEGFAHRRLLGQIELAASTQRPVTLVGERGTGKRTVARAIHERSSHATAPCLFFDLEATGPEAVGHMLFGAGHEAEGPRSMSVPAGSTLVLGDLAHLPRDLQMALDPWLDPADVAQGVRLIFTSVADPRALLEAGQLRPELYYAVTGHVVTLPPLRDRLAELPLLAQHLLETLNARADHSVAGLSEDAIESLRAYDWPGNLRELARAIQTAHDRRPTGLITSAHLPAGIRGALGGAYNPPAPPGVPPLDQTLEKVERHLIEHALQAARHNKSRAADRLGISRPRLYRRMKELEIPDLPEVT